MFTFYTTVCVLDNLAAICFVEEHLLLENGWDQITLAGLRGPLQNEMFQYKLLASLNAKGLEKREVFDSVSERRSCIKIFVVAK